MSDHSVRAELLAAGAPKERESILSLIERMESELVRALDEPMAPAVLSRAAAFTLHNTPELYECTSESLLGALVLCEQLALEPNVLGHTHLAPYAAGCAWSLGYSGVCELARRSLSAAAVRARVVWNSDEYRYWEDERGEHFKYVAGDRDARERAVGVIATWHERTGSKWFPRAIHVDAAKIDALRKHVPGGGLGVQAEPMGAHSAWVTTGLLCASPPLPLEPDAGIALAFHDRVIGGLVIDERGAAQPELAKAPDA